jgi:tetratricopeptide (TPR) repeat protein
MRPLSRALAAAAVASVTALPSFAATATSLDEAKALSAETGLPILMKVGTEWCASCKAFDKASTTNGEFVASLDERVVLLRVDAEKGTGVDVARTHDVSAYPTFILANSEGEMIDRWMGFEKAKGFDWALNAALEDPTTFNEKLARFRASPNEIDAMRIGAIRMGEGLFAEAVGYFRRADDLSSGEDVAADLRVFEALSRGVVAKLYDASDLTAQADAIIADEACTSMDRMRVMSGMQKAAYYTGEKNAHLPYLKAAYEQSEGDADEYVQSKRKGLEADYLLHVKNQPKQALEAKRAAMPEGWNDNANQLNNFAWWCFENNLELDKAEKLARRGVELAEAGTMKANILDTLAEICNLSGNCGDAVEYMHLAVVEAPENEYFQKQLDRFQTLLAAQ